MGQQQQPTLDRIVIQGELQEVKKTLEEQKKIIDLLKERIVKLEADAGVAEAGFHIIANALELYGILKNGEPTQKTEKEPTEPQTQPQLEKPKWNPEKIKWSQAKGARGNYERCPEDNQKVEAIPDYKALLQDLKEHKMFFFRDGWNYWLFPDLVTVGRKRKEAKP